MSTKISALQRAIDIAGGGKALASELGVSPMAVSQWKRRGIPVGRVHDVVRISKGQIQAYELRPDLPELFPVPTVSSIAA